MKLERLIVVGAGAVGGSIGGLLWERGLPIELVARGAHGAALRERGLALRLPEREVHVRAPCVEYIDQVDWRSGDVALLATKLQDAELALDELRVAASPELPIVCALNGVHGEPWAAARFDCVLSMLVWLPATHLEPGEVRLHGSGCIGVLDTGPSVGAAGMELAEELCAHLRDAGFDAIVRADIARWKLAKWITNLGGAAQALVADDWERVAAVARGEGEAVLEAAGFDRVPTEELLARIAHVDVAPVDGQPRAGGSTWQSFARGRPLESAYLEGAMAELAGRVGVPAPVNAALARLARAPRVVTATEVLGG